MKVKLVSYNPDGERVVAIAAKISRSRKGWDYHENMSQEEIETWIRDSILHGYWSVLEHSVYTFSIEGISRVASHQLVRHRIASYTQTSHRFAKPVDEYYRPVSPPSARGKIEQAYIDLYKEYYTLLQQGVPEEDARYLLPNGVNTNLVVTMNARELYNFFGLRICSRAQWEIRAVAWLMLDEVRKVHPRLFRYAGPNCILHENFVRPEDDPVTLEQEKQFTSARCIEGVPREGIWKCMKNSRNILEKLK
ncbi:FAD-dependent thymidylate synthase [Metallosphaera tengchongensis]|uniref:Flavin-dependent thymidylate synthase n=1 Tax=Metallosphaera tengchongensis TaxID=1532350 RepID=A0A6N0NUB7_9CREN|nr:FAD-dependent thymidylate synthase [Metallosphaera tengchongensis]QKQ99492.1 FAD-dependent thymidylate synthase [Metallosphaera tengchongensis]